MTLFVTGTDTGVGKTVVAALLAAGSRELAKKVGYYKPVQTGPENEDALRVAHITGLPVIPAHCHYPHPLSPNQAFLKLRSEASHEPEEVDLEKLTAQINSLASGYDWLICEGAGGLYVPLNRHHETWKDVVARLGCPYVVVARSQLGTLNHSQLTLDALKGVKGSGFLVMNGEPSSHNFETLAEISERHGVKFLGHQPIMDLEDLQALKENGRVMAHAIDHDLASRPSFTLWHPYTQHGLGIRPVDVASARGNTWTLRSGEKLLDGISSWWTSVLGHGHPELGSALKQQQQTLDHVLFGNITHRPARELADLLVRRCQGSSHIRATPAFDHVFFSDNGSTAVEAGLKMAYVYSKRKSKRKSRHRQNHQEGYFVALRGGYHGDTLGAMSMSKTSGFHADFHSLCLNTQFLNPRYTHEKAQGDVPREYFAEHHDQIDGVIVEPLVQGASGMKFIDPAWLVHVIELCADYDIPLIFDEVFTGVHRLGSYLAIHRLGREELFSGSAPQIICLSKGLTGGTVPLAVTITKKQIFDVFWSQNPKTAFQHGHTFTANPIACHVACKADALLFESLEYQAGQSVHITKMQELYHSVIRAEAHQPFWQNPRALGSLFAFELAALSGLPDHGQCQKFTEINRKKGLFVRPLGSTFYLAPALNTPLEELDRMCQIMVESLRECSPAG